MIDDVSAVVDRNVGNDIDFACRRIDLDFRHMSAGRNEFATGSFSAASSGLPSFVGISSREFEQSDRKIRAAHAILALVELDIANAGFKMLCCEFLALANTSCAVFTRTPP